MRLVSSAILLALAACMAGCAGTELTPVVPAGTPYVDDQNPVYIPLGKDSYGTVVENIIRVLADYGFDIEYSNRYDGTIQTKPRVAPGLGLILKHGSPDLYERALYTAQSYRNRIIVKIHPAEQGGYFIEVAALKELEDLPRPMRSMIGAAIFRNDSELDRDTEVIDPFSADRGWIYKGRDPALEQELIRRMKKLM